MKNSGISELMSLFLPEFEMDRLSTEDWFRSLTPLVLSAAPLDPLESTSSRPSLPASSEAPAPRTRSDYEWSALTRLSLVNCGISRLDASMHLLPALETCDLTDNDISQLQHLQDCARLHTLSLSRNRLQVLSNASFALGNIEQLSLAGCPIQSLDGLEKLYSLQTLDLSETRISDIT